MLLVAQAVPAILNFAGTIFPSVWTNVCEVSEVLLWPEVVVRF